MKRHFTYITVVMTLAVLLFYSISRNCDFDSVETEDGFHYFRPASMRDAEIFYMFRDGSGREGKNFAISDDRFNDSIISVSIVDFGGLNSRFVQLFKDNSLYYDFGPNGTWCARHVFNDETGEFSSEILFDGNWISVKDLLVFDRKARMGDIAYEYRDNKWSICSN